MKVLVAVKRVADAYVKVRAKSDGSGPDLDNVKMAINPFCEIAVEEAVRLKEKGIAEEIIAISVGAQACKEQIRAALALGADRGVLINCGDLLPEPLAVARALHSFLQREPCTLCLLGKQSIDGDNNQVGQMLAALWGRPQGTFASALQFSEDGDSVQVTREVDGGLQTVSLQLPAVVTTDLRLNEPRYASLPNIMKAKRKEIAELDPEELGIDMTAQMEVLKMMPPPERKAGVRVASVDDLVNKLRDEAKVIS